MKELHLLCNAHLDPAWLWRRSEGIAEALSTFRIAASFCEEYDGFIFNHNEAILYEWVEEYEPELFERIKKLVKEKKWVIMGGWYLQPDCVMPSGESFISQIELGNDYFMEKFGTKPSVAINFDPFGHTRGLVQILKKMGYGGYLFMRPEDIKGDFLWQGFDGSTIKGHGMFRFYSTQKCHAVEKVQDALLLPTDTGLCLWGIGNHGGGPSKTDLEAINEFIKTSDVKITHSSAEEYFKTIDEENLPVIDKSLVPCFVGCYTTMNRIKRANRSLENKIAVTDKIMSYAQMSYGIEADTEKLKEAKKALAYCQFHDILPGTAIKEVEEDSLKTFGYGEEITDKLFLKAFLKMCDGQRKANNHEEIPIMIFNPHPYEIEGVFEVEFLLESQNRDFDTTTVCKVYDEGGNPLPTQVEKPSSTLNLDWVKKVSFKGKLNPSGITRFDCKLTVISDTGTTVRDAESEFITVNNDRMTFSVDRKTGAIALYEVDGKAYVKDSGIIDVYRDVEDPWGLEVKEIRDYEGSFSLMTKEEANEFSGYPNESYPAVRIVEDGDVRMKIQAVFKYKRNTAVVGYTVYKELAYVDVDIRVQSLEPLKMIRYRLDTQLSGKPMGDTAFGYQELFSNGYEDVYQKWCGIEDGDNALYVINNGTYGGFFSESAMNISLLRTPIYAAHPIDDRPVAPHDRFLRHVDIGERFMSFRLTTDKDVARMAQVFNETPFAMSFFPSGEGEAGGSLVEIDNPKVILSSVKAVGDTYRLALYNATDNENEAAVKVMDKSINLTFGKHELKFVEI